MAYLTRRARGLGAYAFLISTSFIKALSTQLKYIFVFGQFILLITHKRLWGFNGSIHLLTYARYTLHGCSVLLQGAPQVYGLPALVFFL